LKERERERKREREREAGKREKRGEQKWIEPTCSKGGAYILLTAL